MPKPELRKLEILEIPYEHLEEGPHYNLGRFVDELGGKFGLMSVRFEGRRAWVFGNPEHNKLGRIDTTRFKDLVNRRFLHRYIAEHGRKLDKFTHFVPSENGLLLIRESQPGQFAEIVGKARREALKSSIDDWYASFFQPSGNRFRASRR